MDKKRKISGTFSTPPVAAPSSPLGTPKRRSTVSSGSLGDKEPPSSAKANTKKNSSSAFQKPKGEFNAELSDQDVLFNGISILIFGVAVLNLALVLGVLIFSSNLVILPDGFKFSDLSDPLSIYYSQEQLRQVLETTIVYLSTLLVLFIVGTIAGIAVFIKAGGMLKRKKGHKNFNLASRWVVSLTPFFFLTVSTLTILKFIFAG